MTAAGALPSFRPKERPASAKTQRVRARSAWNATERCGNIRVAALSGLPQMPILGEHDKVMAIAGYGPSLLASLDELRAEEAHVWTVSGAHDVLLDAGVTVRGHIEADPRPHKARFLDRPKQGVCYLIATSCSSEVFRALRGADVRLWHVLSTDEETEAINLYWPDAFLLRAGTNVGISAVSVGYALGYRRFRLYGIDCSFAATKTVLEWPARVDLPDELRKEIGFHAGPHGLENQAPLRIVVPLDPPRTFITSAQMLQAAQDFIDLHRSHGDLTFELRGDGLLPALIRALDLGRLSGDPVSIERPGMGRVTFAI